MSNENWANRWATGNTPWHRLEVHPDLVARADEFLGDDARRVFVPLCGKTLDVSWLAAQGHQVIGVELIEAGIRELCEDQGTGAVIAEAGSFFAFRAPNIDLYVGDLFDLTPGITGDIDRIWDRASMVAVPPDVRGDYVRALRELSGPGTKLLLSVVSYDLSVMSGPPWSVPRDEIERLYEDCEVTLLRDEDVIEETPRWRELGHQWWRSSLYAVAW